MIGDTRKFINLNNLKKLLKILSILKFRSNIPLPYRTTNLNEIFLGPYEKLEEQGNFDKFQIYA